jgi:hypothetical protein
MPLTTLMAMCRAMRTKMRTIQIWNMRARGSTVDRFSSSATSKGILKLESSGLQFRAEFYNIFNHTNFTGFGTTFGASNFGQAIAARDARTIQFGLPLYF